MWTLLFLGALALCVLGGGFLVLPLLLIVAVLWLVALPFRVAFWVLGGLVHVLGGLLGLVLAPVALLALGVLLVVAFIVALVSLLAPLMPLVLLGLLGWAIYRIASQRPSPTF